MFSTMLLFLWIKKSFKKGICFPPHVSWSILNDFCNSSPFLFLFYCHNDCQQMGMEVLALKSDHCWNNHFQLFWLGCLSLQWLVLLLGYCWLIGERCISCSGILGWIMHHLFLWSICLPLHAVQLMLLTLLHSVSQWQAQMSYSLLYSACQTWKYIIMCRIKPEWPFTQNTYFLSISPITLSLYHCSQCLVSILAIVHFKKLKILFT